MNRLNDTVLAKAVIAPVSLAVGAVSSANCTLIDATGFSRARFVFSFGANSGTTAALSAGLGAYNAATSGAAFTAITSAALAATTSGALSGNIMIIDTVIATEKPWLMVSGGSVLSTAILASCVVELYRGVSRPPTHTESQIVTIG
jgi:hypothetical protein